MASKGVTKAGEAFCMSCGAGVEPDSHRCESCYSQLDEEVKAFRCPRCGKVLELGMPQCTKCHMKFRPKTVRSSDEEEDGRIVSKLMDWGRSGKEARPAPAKGAAPEEGSLTMGEAKAVSGLLKKMSELADLRAEAASSMGTRISEARNRISQMLETGPSGEMVDGIYTELASIEKDLERIDEVLAMIRSLSEDVSEVFSMPGPSGLAGGRDVSLRLPASLSGASRGDSQGLSEREEQLRQREEMVDRKIKAYAQKKKELEAALASGQQGSSPAPSGLGQKATDKKTAALAYKVRTIHELVAAEGACDDMEPCLASLETHLRRLVVERSELEQTLAQMKEGESEVRALMKVLDGLLGQLPTDVVDRFSKSEEFKLYERVLDRLRV